MTTTSETWRPPTEFAEDLKERYGLLCPPRWGTPRHPGRKSLGPKLWKVMERLGAPPMPWQKYVSDVALEIDPAARVVVNSDSELMVRQMKGEYRVKNEELRSLYEQAQRLAEGFEQPVTFRHVRREQNSRADALCNEVLNNKRPSSLRDLALPKPASTLFDPLPEPAPAAEPPLSDEAVACLQKALAATSSGKGPTAEEVWQQLTVILRRHGVRVPG